MRVAGTEAVLKLAVVKNRVDEAACDFRRQLDMFRLSPPLTKSTRWMPRACTPVVTMKIAGENLSAPVVG